MKWPDLTDILSEVPWAVVGAVATRMYMPERTTRDLDVVVAVAQTERASLALLAAGWQRGRRLSIGGSSWIAPDGSEVDVIEGNEPWWPGALAQARNNRDSQGLPVLPLPYLILMKFRASRTVDIGDIARMLGGADAAALEATRQLFQQLEPSGLDHLESLIELGRWEVGGATT